jgi:lipoprotein-anchoring transpeptidase ErfK/SrfK
MFPLRVVTALVFAFAIVGGIVAAGAVLRDDDTDTPSAAPTVSSTSTIPTSTTTTLPPTTTTTAPPIPELIQPAPAVLPAPPQGGWGSGSRDPLIQAYEQRLYDVHIDPGAIDGYFDQSLRFAMETIEKLANLPRNGRIDLAEALILKSFQYPPPIHATAEPDRTEIDIAKQVITLYDNYQVRLITTTSTASGEEFCYVTPRRAPTQRICEVATTPNGRFTYYFFYDGWQKGDLGSLYNPYYFFKGRAIHGYDSVPTEPASHGCSRIPMHIAKYWYTLVKKGDAVYVDNGPANGEQILSTTAI